MNHDNSDTDRLADPFDQHRDDEPTGYNSTAFGRGGTGTTERIARHARHRADDADTAEFIDPKVEKEAEENGG
jgi:hypothetical protein